MIHEKSFKAKVDDEQTNRRMGGVITVACTQASKATMTHVDDKQDLTKTINIWSMYMKTYKFFVLCGCINISNFQSIGNVQPEFTGLKFSLFLQGSDPLLPDLIVMYVDCLGISLQ